MLKMKKIAALCLAACMAAGTTAAAFASDTTIRSGDTEITEDTAIQSGDAKVADDTAIQSEDAQASAEELQVTAENFVTQTVDLNTLSIVYTDPDVVTLGDDEDTINLMTGDSGTFVIDETADLFADLGTVKSVSFGSDSNALTVNSDGTYTANYAESFVYVSVKVTYEAGDGYTEWKTFYYEINIYPDMDEVTLDTTSYTYYKSADAYYSGAKLTVNINSDYSFDLYDEMTDVSVSSSNSDIYVSWDLEDNVFTFSFCGSGKTTLTITLNDKTYKIKVKIVEISCSTDSVLLAKGQTKKVKVKKAGSDAKIKWKSSNKKVATVNSKGKIKAKKYGNAVITATVNGTYKVGCAVSVTTKKKVKAIKWAIKYIASGAEYSQAKRMQSGYYDCSSLVWRAYAHAGIYIGSRYYAPTAADTAKTLYNAGKLKGKCTYKKTQKMVMQAGDLIFKTGADNGRFRGIYHVELFCGYALSYYDSDGTPVVTTTWASRGNGYGNYADLYGTP